MHDYRKDIAYLCAIFIMLAIGMLVGMSYTGPDLVRRQSDQLKALRVQVNGAVRDGQVARDQLNKMQDAVERLRPGLVRGMLSGHRVAVIQTGDSADATRSAREALADAGEQIVTVVLNSRILHMPTKERDDLSASLAEATGQPAPASDDPADGASLDPILRALAILLTQGTKDRQANVRVRQILEASGLVTLEGDVSGRCAAFVLVGGGHDDPSVNPDADSSAELDVPLIDDLRAAATDHLQIAGCEPSDCVVSYIPAYQSREIATVDCIDLPLGKHDLPFAVRGGLDANDYGVKATATRQIPPSLEEQPGT